MSATGGFLGEHHTPTYETVGQASALAALVDAYADADAAVKAAEDRRKDLRDQLLMAYYQREDLTQEPPMAGKASTVTVSRVEAWRVDTKRLKAEHPEVYAAYARKSTSTRLTVVPRG